MRFRHILLPLLSFLCLSCSDETVGPLVNEYPVEVELCCDMTKVGTDGESLFWQSGDQVAFRAAGASGASAVAVLTLNDVDSGLGKAKFRGTVVMAEEPVTCEFAYPATAFDEEGRTVFDYSRQDGTHRPYLYGSAAYSADGMDCTLGHVGGLIRLKVADGVESVSLSSNSGSYSETLSEGMAQYDGQKISKVLLSGEGTLSPADDASHLIDVSVPSGRGIVYVFMPALEFVDGFSVVCNHSDGRKMFRSFSKTGGNFSSFTFEEGAVLDIDLSDFQGFTADCTCECEHVYDESNILTDTDVTLTGFTFSGSPEKIIDQWGVAIYDDKGRFIRWTYGEGAFDGNAKLMSDYTGDWPLLIPGEYTLHAICNINGHTLKFPASETMYVTAPDFNVNVSGKTSWDYRTNPSRANSMDNDAIVEIGAKVNISSSILASDKYDCKVVFSVPGKSSGEYDMDVAEYTSDCIFDGLSWGTHELEASVTFCGITQKNAVPLTCYITGLPYKADWTKNDYPDWYYDSDVSDNGQAIKFEGPAGKRLKRRIISPEFKIPSDMSVNVKTAISAASCNVDFIGLDYERCRYFYYKSGTRTTSVDCSGDYISATYYASINLNEVLGSEYVLGSNAKTLSSSNPCMVYSTESYTHDKYLLGITINYSE